MPCSPAAPALPPTTRRNNVHPSGQAAANRQKREIKKSDRTQCFAVHYEEPNSAGQNLRDPNLRPACFLPDSTGSAPKCPLFHDKLIQRRSENKMCKKLASNIPNGNRTNVVGILRKPKRSLKRQTPLTLPELIRSPQVIANGRTKRHALPT